MSYRGAVREGLASASSLADTAIDGRTVHLGDVGRRCANAACAKLLARLNREVLCFACQRARDEQKLLDQARPVTDARGLNPLRGRGRRAER